MRQVGQGDTGNYENDKLMKCEGEIKEEEDMEKGGVVIIQR